MKALGITSALDNVGSLSPLSIALPPERHAVLQHQRLAGFERTGREAGIGDVQEPEAVPQQPAVLGITGISLLVVDSSPGRLSLEDAGHLGPAMLAQHVVLGRKPLLRADDRLGRAAVAGGETETEPAKALLALRGAKDLHRLVEGLEAQHEVDRALRLALRG